jgi:N-methylhydantoinase B
MEDKKLDLVTLEVIRNALPAISNEMSFVLQRTSYNMMIYEVRDYCCGLLDTEGNLLSQNTGGVSHFVADLGTIIKDGVNKYGKDGFKPGDVIITNHQRVGGQHLNNMVVYTPFYFGDELFAFPTVRAHWVDVGGTSTGFGSAATIDPWMEGLQIDQIKVYSEGKLDRNVWQMLSDNIRYPEASLGDLRSQIASCRLAERRLEELLQRYGKDIVVAAIKRIFGETEARCRAIIEKVPDGIYEAESFFGRVDNPVKIKAIVTIKGSDMTIDLTQCSAQRNDAANSRTLSGPRVAYKAITMPLDPVNEGSFGALKIIIQEGNFMMAKYPAVMADWSAPIPKVVDTIIQALSKAMPDRIPAGHHSSLGGAMVFFGNEPNTGKRFVSQSIEGGGWGGRPWEDGESASVSVCQGDVRNAPIEKVELKWPLMIMGRELRQDSGGPGKFRGGLGISTRAKNLVEGNWNILSRRTGRLPSFGLWRGKPGSEAGSMLRLPGEEEFHDVALGRHSVPPDSEALFITGGGGGWGDPIERDPEKVLWDVKEGYISAAAANEEYGVVIDQVTLLIDKEATLQRRQILKNSLESK